jgi:hypothetical protein
MFWRVILSLSSVCTEDRSNISSESRWISTRLHLAQPIGPCLSVRPYTAALLDKWDFLINISHTHIHTHCLAWFVCTSSWISVCMNCSSYRIIIRFTKLRCACAIVYCHLWPVWLCHVFPYYLINGTIFVKKVIEYKMCVLVFSTTFVWNNSHSRRIKRYIRNVHRSSCKVSIMLVRF